MKMKCVNNKEYEERLTVGKIYEVKESDFSDNFYMLIGDDGEELDVFRHRFEEVKTVENEKSMGWITLQEVFNYQCGAEFEMKVCDNRKQKVRLTDYELIIVEGYKKDSYVTKVYNLKALLEAKFYLLESWKEIDYYTAYTNSNSNIKYIHDNEEIIGTHYGILSNLDARCRNTGEDLVALLSDAKWYVKVV